MIESLNTEGGKKNQDIQDVLGIVEDAKNAIAEALRLSKDSETDKKGY